MRKTAALRLAHAMAAEVQRARKGLHSRGHPRPYYVSFLMRDEMVWNIQAKFGTLFADSKESVRNGFADVRVGSYRNDQVQEGGLEDNSKDDESYGYVSLPIGDRIDGIRHGLWRLMESRYREAIDALLRKKAHELTYVNPYRHLPSFEKRKPTIDLAWRKLPQVDRDAWRRYVLKASAVCKRYPQIKNSYVELRVRDLTQIFASSEGSLQLQRRTYWHLECYLWLLSKRGDAFPYSISHYGCGPKDLPDSRAFHSQIRRKIADLDRLATAPPLRSYSGPVLLEPRPAGLLIHEAIGHRLEGNRLLSSGEGQTYRDSLGRRVFPTYLSVRDDPTIERWDGQPVVGHYIYDDEGVEASTAELITKGRLVGFLTSRTAIHPRHRSNGHARSSSYERPISRMGVTIIEPEDGLDERDLREAFLAEIRRQGVPYGIRIIEASAGETATDAYNFQAFLGEINLAAKVFPDGREEWVRGVDFVGTPLNAVRGIIAAGKRLEVDNSDCGAESGYVPVTTISPALLVRELELQSKSEIPYTQYAYPMPWEKE